MRVSGTGCHCSPGTRSATSRSEHSSSNLRESSQSRAVLDRLRADSYCLARTTLFALGVRSEIAHTVEQAMFFGTGLLFWWPVIQPCQAPQLGRDGRCSCTFFWRLCRATSFPDFSSSLTVSHTRCIFPLRGCLAFPFLKISSVRPHSCDLRHARLSRAGGDYLFKAPSPTDLA